MELVTCSRSTGEPAEPSASQLLPSVPEVEASWEVLSSHWLPSPGMALTTQVQASSGLISCTTLILSRIIILSRTAEVFPRVSYLELRMRTHSSQKVGMENTESASCQVFSHK